MKRIYTENEVKELLNEILDNSYGKLELPNGTLTASQAMVLLDYNGYQSEYENLVEEIILSGAKVGE